MPVERRDILFFFSEIQAALHRARQSPQGEAIPEFADNWPIVEALHTRAGSRGEFRDRDERMLGLVSGGDCDESGVVFRASRAAEKVPTRDGGVVVRGRDFGFFVPDLTMREVLVAECRRRKIMLPASAEKEIIVEGMTVGLRILLADKTLELET